MKEARFYEKSGDEKVKCLLCPHNCLIKEDNEGICRIRINRNGKLYTYVYNRVAAIHNDPIEKKPLYHFFPGSNVLSVGEIGCNFKCRFCQNASISQCNPNNFNRFLSLTPTQLVNHALASSKNIGIAYTYNEPFTYFEYMYDCSKLASSKGLKNVVVSNGYVNPEPLKELIPYIDAFNIDLKAFNENFYRIQAKGSLQPVLDNLLAISKAGKHLEITFLAITGLNDNENEFSEMVSWISEEIGKNTPFHISRYFPAHETTNPPTSFTTLENFYNIASKKLNFIYLGNVVDEKRSSTFCPECSALLIKRSRFSSEKKIVNSYCPKCGNQINIIL